MVTKGERVWGKDKLRVWDQQIQTTIYKIDKQQGHTVQHRKLYSVSYNKPYGNEYGKEYMYTSFIYVYMYIHIYMYKSLS